MLVITRQRSVEHLNAFADHGRKAGLMYLLGDDNSGVTSRYRASRCCQGWQVANVFWRVYH